MGYRTPAEAVEVYNAACENKVRMGFVKTFVSAIFAGFIIAMGSTVANTVAFAMPNASAMRLVSSLLFPFGLALILLTGTELFTGNVLLGIPCQCGRVKPGGAVRNLAIVYLGNLVGGGVTALCMAGFGQLDYGGGQLAVHTIRTAAAKCDIPFMNGVVLGIFCNILVCLGVFVAQLSVGYPGKILFSYLPVCFFVVCGFEHCVANMYFIPAGLFAAANPAYAALAAEAGVNMANLNLGGFLLGNLLPVTIGNLLGGLLLAVFLWRMYGVKKADA